MYVIYEEFEKTLFENPWFCPGVQPVAAFRDEGVAREFAARTPPGGKSEYFVKSADPWKGGGLLSKRTIVIPFELFRKIVTYFVFGYRDGKIEIELHDELENFISEKNIKP